MTEIGGHWSKPPVSCHLVESYIQLQDHGRRDNKSKMWLHLQYY